MKKILIVVGTRPNFIKITQCKRVAAEMGGFEVKIAHTGQHFDQNMSEVFFSQFQLKPDHYLHVSQASALTQMGEILMKLETLIREEFAPDLIMVPGDVNSTLAVALVANKLGIPLAHLESGLRSFDRDMPEEINRILTDEISDYYFVTEASGLENLERERKTGQAFLVGNTMIDTLVAYESEIDQATIMQDLGIAGPFVLMTIHRPSNVDSQEGLEKLARLLEELSSRYQVVFPIHPRTRNNIEKFGLEGRFQALKNVIQTEAMGYFEFQQLVKNSKLVLTDSGGIQEETTFRQVPCLTLRENTERPSTVTMGTNTLCSFEVDTILDLIGEIETGRYKAGAIPPLWDGKATERIFEILSKSLG